jgi:hypothetical protein
LTAILSDLSVPGLIEIWNDLNASVLPGTLTAMGDEISIATLTVILKAMVCGHDLLISSRRSHCVMNNSILSSLIPNRNLRAQVLAMQALECFEDILSSPR